MKKLAVLAVAGLISVTASAENWVFVKQNPHTAMYLDTDSISNSGKYKTLFIRNIYAQPRFISPSRIANNDISLLRLDCKSSPKRYQLLSQIAYNGTASVSSSGYNENAEWLIIYPGTFGTTLVSLVCSR